MPDGAIVIPDTAAAPKDYTLSGAQEIALKSVRALIDGTGAGSAFLPTLQLLDPNGHVMWEGAAQSTVAAGGSADVSWFPGLGATGGATPPPVTTATSWGYAAVDPLHPFTVPAGAHTTYANMTSFATNDPATFASGIDSFGAGVHTVLINSEGTYQISVTALLSGPPAGSQIRAYYDPPLVPASYELGNPDFVPSGTITDRLGVLDLGYGDTAHDGIVFPVGGGAWIETFGTPAPFTATMQMYVTQISATREVLD
jgi:hypothetical protein